MRFWPFSLRILGSLGLSALAMVALRAQPDTSSESPFLPATGGGASSAPVTQGAPLELHGIIYSDEGPWFSLFDSAKKTATWVRLNETGRNFVVRTHEIMGGNDQITVEYQGNVLTLSLKTAKISSGGTMGSVLPGGAPPYGTAQPVVMNPTPADEAARLQAVAEAVQRRRALRQQASAAAKAATQGAGPQPTTSAPLNPQR